MAGSLKENFNKILSTIDESRPNDLKVELLAVSKKQSSKKIEALHLLGVENFGENYLQEAIEKMEQLKKFSINWHFIGQLQSKKIKDIVGRFSLIQTVSRPMEIEKISTVASQKNITQKILIQINIGDEESKQGVCLRDLGALVSLAEGASHVELCGFMVFPPLEENIDDSLRWFKKANFEFQKYREKNGPNFQTLSMGTSQDYPLAVKSGATLVRIGEALMGSRL